MDRSHIGELLAVWGLALTGPGACIAATGRLNTVGIALWIAFGLYFGSGVYYVKLLVAGAREQESISRRTKWLLGWPLGAYHLVLISIVALSGSMLEAADIPT